MPQQLASSDIETESFSTSKANVICVNLDGTLIVGDLLVESFVTLFRRNPFRALVALVSLRKGKAAFKREIARLVRIDPARLTYRAVIVDRLRHLRRKGATTVLATASDAAYARAVAEHLGLFTEVVASDGHTNLAGSDKAAMLVQRYGQFEYIGNDWADLPVWRAATVATAVAAPRRLVRYGGSDNPIKHVLEMRARPVAVLLRALRPHQWVKNLLVFVPLIAAHTASRVDMLSKAALTFIAFSASASAIYLLNDIFDIEADRQHPRKRHRPIAAGDLTIKSALIVAIGLFASAVTLAAGAISWTVALSMIGYGAVTGAYSLKLKQVPVADVFTLTGLYMLRIVVGGFATDTPLSFWFLAYALFVFLSLAFVKRYTEILRTPDSIRNRGYRHEDGAWMQAVGTSAGYMAVVVLALYVNAPETSALYARPGVLWLLGPLLLFWLTRLWFRAGRAVLDDDPVLEALKDPTSYAVAAVCILLVLAAS